MTIEHAISIDASPAAVWQTTIDIDRWPEWTPTVRSARRLDSTPLALGSTARLRQPGMPPAIWRVTRFEAGRSFTWESKSPGMRLVATHTVEPDGTAARSLLSLEVSSILASALGPIVRRSASRSLARENEGLKAVCESVGRSPGDG